MSLISADHRCPGNSRSCDQHLKDVPEFTWSLVAAGDLREERNERNEKKSGSPQGWEEGKSEGITFPPIAGEFHFSTNFLNRPQTSIFSALLNFVKDRWSITFFSKNFLEW